MIQTTHAPTRPIAGVHLMPRTQLALPLARGPGAAAAAVPPPIVDSIAAWLRTIDAESITPWTAPAPLVLAARHACIAASSPVVVDDVAALDPVALAAYRWCETRRPALTIARADLLDARHLLNGHAMAPPLRGWRAQSLLAASWCLVVLTTEIPDDKLRCMALVHSFHERARTQLTRSAV